ncbi:stalk domain-containing protein, partial [Peptoniphilus hominis (ex Hitch et al. 2025)]
MYLLKKKIGTKFWIILLALTILVSAFTMPVFAAGQSKKQVPPAKQEETLKSAPISLKEIEEPIPNPQYQYYLNHKEEFTYGYIPPKYIFPQEKTRSIRTRSGSPTSGIRKYDSTSDKTNENRFGRSVVTPVKSQYHTGTCWAQANLSVIETLLKIKYNKDFDLSEGHMAYNIDNYTDLQSGGSDDDVLAYCARLAGPVLESNFPAYTIDENDPQNRSQKEFDPSRASLLPENERDTFKIMGDAFNKKLDVFVPKTLELDLTLENLKKCIYEYGSVSASYFVAYDGYSKDVLGDKYRDKMSVFYNGIRYHLVKKQRHANKLDYNHTVALIGWDDDKEITNNLGETARGAFLVKNSIKSPSSQDKGYHWISYESFLGKGDIHSVFDIFMPQDVRLMSQDERKNLKNVYNTGKTSYAREANIKGNLNKAINIYERSNNEPETIKYLTYYNISEGPAPYKIFINEDTDLLKGHKTTFANGTQGETLEDIQSDKWVELASGTFTEKGYNTLEVTKPFTLTSDKFALKIEIESKKLGLAYKSWSEGEKVPAISYRYNDENADPFFEKIRDSYCLFLGTVTVKANEYTVTVSSDTNGTATSDLAKGPKGTKVNLKAQANQGYEFDKWELEGATVADPQASETILTIGEGDASAKAIFKEIPPTEYTVSFETAYGTKPEDQKIKEGEKAKVPTGFEKDKTEIIDSANGKTYIFKGWFIGTEEYNFEKEVKENKTLIAKWEEKIIPIKEYTVSFETAYGTKPDDQKIKEGEKATPPQGYEKDKTEILDSTSGKTYVFKGWFIDTEEYNFEKEVKENKTLTAKWEENKATGKTLEEEKDKAKEEIDKLPNLSEEEKDTYKGQVDEATDKAGVEKAVEDAKSKDTENKAAKDAQELKDAKDAAKEEIDKLPKLSDAEKDKYKKQVEDAKTKGQVAKVVEEAKEKSAGGQTPPTPTPNPSLDDKIDDTNKKPVYPTDQDQGTGVIVNEPDNKDVVGRDEDGKNIPAVINPNTGEIIVNPGNNVDGPIVITVVDTKTGERKDIVIDVFGHTAGRNDNRDYDHNNWWYTPFRPSHSSSSSNTSVNTNVTKKVSRLEAKLVIGSKEMIKSVDGVDQKVYMDIAPFIEGDRTMLPIRFVAEALGFNVQWDNENRTVILIDKENVVKIP